MSKSHIARPASKANVQDVSSQNLEKIELRVNVASEQSLKNIVEAHRQKWDPNAGYWNYPQGASRGSSTANWGYTDAKVIRVKWKPGKVSWKPQHLQEPLKALLKLKAKPKVVETYGEWILTCSTDKNDDLLKQHAKACMFVDLLDPTATDITFTRVAYQAPKEKVHTFAEAEVKQIVQKVRRMTADEVTTSLHSLPWEATKPFSIDRPFRGHLDGKTYLHDYLELSSRFPVKEIIPVLKALGLKPRVHNSWIRFGFKGYGETRTKLMVLLLGRRIRKGTARVVYRAGATADNGDGMAPQLTKYQRLALQKLEAAKSGLSKDQFSQLRRDLLLV